MKTLCVFLALAVCVSASGRYNGRLALAPNSYSTPNIPNLNGLGGLGALGGGLGGNIFDLRSMLELTRLLTQATRDQQTYNQPGVFLPRPNAQQAIQANAMLADFNQNAAPVLSAATQQSLDSLMALTEAAVPLLEEITKATLPKIREYTSALERYNKEGGEFPEPPKEIRAFGLFGNDLDKAPKRYQ